MQMESNGWQKDIQNKNKDVKPILPPAVIGILGGGQLGRMMALEARRMGYGIITLDPTPNSPCAQIADKQIEAPFDSEEGAEELAKCSDVVTYEFENIGANMADRLEAQNCLPQGYQLLYTTQNRLREKQAIEAAGAKVAPYSAILSEADLREALYQFGLPAVLKTTEGGYDGKGQLVIKGEKEIAEALEWIQNSPQERVLEQFVPFHKEVSVVVARNQQGHIEAFPVAENHHRDNILHASIVPARISARAVEQALNTAFKLAAAFNLVGLLAIEMFLLEDDTVYVNELAPRPHNSGHYTQQGCYTSQFEQHVRAVCNLPLASTELIKPTVMVNVLGEHLEAVTEALPRMDASMKLHLYGKVEAKPKRKMGHLNVVGETTAEALQKIDDIKIWEMEEII